MRRVLVCGDRNWDEPEVVFEVLSGVAQEMPNKNEPLVVISGGAQGADTAAEFWSKVWEHHSIPTMPPVVPEIYPADWTKYGRSAGPIRNKQMLVEGKPDVVWAFHDHLEDSKGTKNMVEIAVKAGIPVYHVSRIGAGAVKPDVPVDVATIRQGLQEIVDDVEKLF